MWNRADSKWDSQNFFFPKHNKITQHKCSYFWAFISFETTRKKIHLKRKTLYFFMHETILTIQYQWVISQYESLKRIILLKPQCSTNPLGFSLKFCEKSKKQKEKNWKNCSCYLKLDFQKKKKKLLWTILWMNSKNG